MNGLQKGVLLAAVQVALVSSLGTLEVAVVQGNAAEAVGARVGTPVTVEFLDAGA